MYSSKQARCGSCPHGPHSQVGRDKQTGRGDHKCGKFLKEKGEGVRRENIGWEVCREGMGALYEEALFSFYLKNEKGPGMGWEKPQAWKC